MGMFTSLVNKQLGIVNTVAHNLVQFTNIVGVVAKVAQTQLTHASYEQLLTTVQGFSVDASMMLTHIHIS